MMKVALSFVLYLTVYLLQTSQQKSLLHLLPPPLQLHPAPVIGLATTGGTFYNDLSSTDGDLALYNEGITLDSCNGHSSSDNQYHYHANIAVLMMMLMLMCALSLDMLEMVFLFMDTAMMLMAHSLHLVSPSNLDILNLN